MNNNLSFEQTIEFLKNEANTNVILKATYGQDGKKLFPIISKMAEDLNKAINDEETSADQNLLSDLQRICNNTLTIYLTTSFEENERAFFYHFATLCFNWAQALEIESRLVDTINAIIIAMNMHNSCVDAVNSIRLLTDIVNKYLRFDPPAYNVSRAYLESLYAELESDKLK